MRTNSLQEEKRSHCERSSSIRATNTSLKPKAEALRMAVKQMMMLNFKKVAFISDCKPIIYVLQQYTGQTTIPKVHTTESPCYKI